MYRKDGQLRVTLNWNPTPPVELSYQVTKGVPCGVIELWCHPLGERRSFNSYTGHHKNEGIGSDVCLVSWDFSRYREVGQTLSRMSAGAVSFAAGPTSPLELTYEALGSSKSRFCWSFPRVEHPCGY